MIVYIEIVRHFSDCYEMLEYVNTASIRLFDSRSSAVAYARRRGWEIVKS